MSDEQRGFKVKDRRLFTSEGELRGAAEPGPVDRPAGAEPEGPAIADAAPRPGPSSAEPEEVSFASFLISLAAQAGAILESGQDPGDARQIISILEMLGRKTEGRRSPDEDRVLEGLLYQLRLAYVERSRKSPA